jgi:membrane-associated protease RseP (regulator of RpoE activity)
MLPWILVFGLSLFQIVLNVMVILGLLVISTAIYIVLGHRLRTLAREEAIAHSHPQHDPATSLELRQLETAALLQPIPSEDLKLIQGIFGVDTFFATETIPYQAGAIFKGNLRGEPTAAYQQLQSNLSQKLGDRYRLFLVENRESKPVVIVLPASNDPKPATLFQRFVALVLLLVTIVTCLERGSFQSGFTIVQNWSAYEEVLPLAAGVLGVLATHELGHWLWARRHHIRLSPPYFIPAWQLGSFGAITRFESLLPNRSVLFDIAFAGPAAGGGLALLCLIFGLLVPSGSGVGIEVPTDFFRGSILVGSIARVALGSSLQQSSVEIHFLAVIGWVGLIITALNLLPAGQLDGGRIVQAIYGRKVAGRTTVISLILLGIASFANPLALYWALLILVLQRDLERPALNELVEPNDARAALGLLILFLTAVTLLPLTPSVADPLGIGIP